MAFMQALRTQILVQLENEPERYQHSFPDSPARDASFENLETCSMQSWEVIKYQESSLGSPCQERADARSCLQDTWATGDADFEHLDFADTSEGWYPVDSMEVDAVLAQEAEPLPNPSDTTLTCDSADGSRMPTVVASSLSCGHVHIASTSAAVSPTALASRESSEVPSPESAFAPPCDDDVSDGSSSQGTDQVASEHVAHYNAAKCAGMISLGDFLDEEVPRNPWSAASTSIE